MTRRCSSALIVALSPVVPHGTSALLPSAICHSTRLAECVFGDTATGKWRHERRNRAEKHELTSRMASFLWTSGPRSLADKERDCTMSSMWRACLILPVAAGPRAVELGAIRRRPMLRSAAHARRPRANIAYALNDWRRLRQSSGYAFADYARFLIANPGWPDEAKMRRWAEKAMRPGENAATVIAFFANEKPTDRQRLGPARRSLCGERPDGRGARRGAQRLGFGRPRRRPTSRRSGRATAAASPRADHDRRVDALLFAKKPDDAARFVLDGQPAAPGGIRRADRDAAQRSPMPRAATRRSSAR